MEMITGSIEVEALCRVRHNDYRSVEKTIIYAYILCGNNAKLQLIK
jgi:hypothetical protein